LQIWSTNASRFEPPHVGCQSHRNVLFRQKLFHIANGVGAEVENARGEDGVGFALPSKFFRGCEGQTAFAVEQFLQPPVAGTRFAPVDSGRNQLTAFAARAPAFEPVFPTDRAFNRNARDF
jgi:hypothetical protein